MQKWENSLWRNAFKVINPLNIVGYRSTRSRSNDQTSHARCLRVALVPIKCHDNVVYFLRSYRLRWFDVKHWAIKIKRKLRCLREHVLKDIETLAPALIV